MWHCLLFILLWLHATEEVSVKMTCGTSSDITNLNSGILPDSTGLTSKFASLDTSCFGKMKKTLLLLQEAVKEGEKCDAQATRLLGKLEWMCSYLKPLNGYASKFEKVLKVLKLIHKNLDKMTKFADNIPRIGQLRKIIVDKVIPMALDVMERMHKEVRKVIDYERILLRYKKTAKLIWRIDKYGSKVCKLTSPLGLSLQLLSKTVKEVNKPSKIVLQTTNKAQACISAHCLSRGGAASCSECKRADQSFAATTTKIETWKTKMVTCHEKLSKANVLLSKLNVATSLMKIGEKILDKIENFIKPISEKIAKVATSIGKVAANMMSCCPCGRPNTIGCAISATTKIINLVSCPLDGLTNYVIVNFINNMKQQITKLFAINFPKISVDLTFPAVSFEISVPPFFQTCLKQTAYGKGLTKMCGLPGSSIRLEISSSFKAVKSTSIFSSKTSLSSQISSSCSNALNALKKFGNNLKNCFDRVDDLFFAIPIVGVFAAMTCDPDYKDPDPGINYCPCKNTADSLVNADGKQPYCVVWHKSWMKSCTRTCQDKKYSPGKDPSGKTRLMNSKKGYPSCDKLKYYCRKGNVVVKNGRIDCKNEYTYLGGSCSVVPKSGYVCPISHIHCGSISKGKAVCWDYRFIECAKDDGKSFPMCSCRNRDTGGFDKGEIVCQTDGSSSSDSLSGLKEIRRSLSCFRPLGTNPDIKKDCGLNMFPCVVRKPPIDSYERCSMSKAEKFWDAHGKKFVIAGGVFIAIGVLGAIGSCVGSAIPAVVGMILLTIVGIVLLVCGLVIKRQEDLATNYIKMGHGY